MARYLDIDPAVAVTRRCVRLKSIEVIAIEPNERGAGWMVSIYLIASESGIHEHYPTYDEAEKRYTEIRALLEGAET